METWSTNWIKQERVSHTLLTTPPNTVTSLIDPIEYIPHPGGLGLGATPRPPDPKKKQKIKKPGEIEVKVRKMKRWKKRKKKGKGVV